MLNSRASLVAVTVLGLVVMAGVLTPLASARNLIHAGKDMVIVDRASAVPRPVGPSLTLNLLMGAAAGLILGVALTGLRERGLRERRSLRSPPRAPETPQGSCPEELCGMLLAGWFSSHRMLALLGPASREVRAKFAARLGAAFAARGEKTLLADAGSDGSEGIRVKPVAGVENLFVLTAPGERLAAAAIEAGRRFRIVLVDVPAGQDSRHSYAALAGGALIVAAPGPANAAVVQALQAELARIPVRIVGTLVNAG